MYIFVVVNFDETVTMDTKNSVPHYAIIVAGGSGARMQAAMPKQFIELDGQPILMYAVRAFFCYDKNIQIVIVLPETQMAYWQELCNRHHFHIPHQAVTGGKTRFHSVKNGLSLLPDNGLVAIHDGVRPLVSQQTITECFQTAKQYGNAIPTIPVVDSVREMVGNASRMMDRSKLCLVQTPQVFDIQLLKNAYRQEYIPSFTDDASVFETAGHTIRLTKGNVENIKITTQHDLIIAAALKKNLSSSATNQNRNTTS